MIFISIHCGHNATVDLSINGKLVSVISEERITRIKNFEGFPNVSTYEDAYKTFENSNLEYLIIENYLIRKTN